MYDLYYTTIFNYCYRRTVDFNLAKDLTSETFIKAYLNIHRFRWTGKSLGAWLYRIATNELKLYYRSKKYAPQLLLDSGIKAHLYSMPNPDLEYEQLHAESELRKHQKFLEVQQEIKKLPIKYQEVIALKYFEQLKISEISQILRKPEGTIKSLLSRGLDKIRKNM